MKKISKGSDRKLRCTWCYAAPDFLRYHDEEWGFPVSSDFRLFEKLCLEGFQSGLSWRTILSKRQNFRKAFKNFDFYQVSHFTAADVNRLLKDPGIVRHQGKIKAVINNAKRAKEVVEREGSLAAYLWQFEPEPKSLPKPQTVSVSETSILISKTLKKQGWKFVGPTTIFAFMQAMGLINDHAEGCIIRKQVQSKRKLFKRPKLKTMTTE